MDEVDGRPGHVALQSGHLDAHRDVPMVSLSLSHLTPKCTVILSEAQRSRRTCICSLTHSQHFTEPLGRWPMKRIAFVLRLLPMMLFAMPLLRSEEHTSE